MNLPPELRALVIKRSGGRCEYCLIREDDASFAHEVDHIVSLKHGGETEEFNLAYACFICNRFKGSDLGSLDAMGQLVRFFHPRIDRWDEHFYIEGSSIMPVSPESEATARILQFNSARRIDERRMLQRLGRYPRGITQ